MEKYWFKQAQYGDCLEDCNLMNNGIKIGSVACQECKYCISKEVACEFTGDINWIVCSKLESALGNNQNL